MNLKQAIQLYQNMGTRYVMYRVRHEIEKRTGRLKKKHPNNLKFSNPLNLNQWRNTKKEFLIDAKENLSFTKNPTVKLKQDVVNILSGKLKYFNAEWLDIGSNYDWITNPSNEYKYDIAKHWSEIPDLSKEAGDIKFVWEKSRFTYLLTILRYDYHFEQDSSEFVFKEIESWIDANPINQGPNWRCSQEISLRLFNWCYALYYYQNSDALTEERWQKIQQVIYASLHHVYHHIDFSRIAVRNNHAITETLCLTLSNILFPFIPETKKWAEDGKKWFEEEIDYQIYEDGTFLQHSMNYHRVVIQLFSLGISVFEKNQQVFSRFVYDKAFKSVNFLYQCMQTENGWLPNTGANDGALFFPFTDSDYRDYRPQLNSLHFNLTNKHLFDEIYITENCDWLGNVSISNNFTPLSLHNGNLSFPIGGYYIHRDTKSFSLLRCVAFRNRPNQSDNLHLDIWIGGENVLRDQGSYKYNTSKELIDYFKGVEAHNTISISGESQMKRGSRFMWYNWVKKADAKFLSKKDFNIFSEISGFEHIHNNIVHRRNIFQISNSLIWEVEDIIEGASNLSKSIFWHVNPKWEKNVSIKSYDDLGNELSPIIDDVWHSAYYGQKEVSKRITFESKRNIFKTTIEIKK